MVPGLPPIDSDSSVNTLTFSRYPLRPAIVIEAVPRDYSLPLRVAVFAINQEIRIPIPALFDETPDHIVDKTELVPIGSRQAWTKFARP